MGWFSCADQPIFVQTSIDEWDELSLGMVELLNSTGKDVVVPTVDLKTALADRLADIGMGAEIVKLDENIGVGQCRVTGEFAGVVLYLAEILPGRLDVLQPVKDMRQAPETLGRHEGADHA